MTRNSLLSAPTSTKAVRTPRWQRAPSATATPGWVASWRGSSRPGEDTAFFRVADHGMEESDPAVRGDWDVALAEAEVVVRDEGYGFLYLSGA